MTQITLDQLRQIMPYASPSRAAEFLPHLIESMEEFEINTRGRMICYLPQLAHESACFRYMEEIASGAAYDVAHKAKRLGNNKPDAIDIAKMHHSSPGRWWKGHGPIQITGYDNHMACGAALGLDLRHDPTLICEPRNGCRAAAWFWKVNHLNEMADEGDFDGTCAVVNTGDRHTPTNRINGYADRLM